MSFFYKMSIWIAWEKQWKHPMQNQLIWMDIWSIFLILSQFFYGSMRNLLSWELRIVGDVMTGSNIACISCSTQMVGVLHKLECVLIQDTPYLGLTGWRYGLSVVRSLEKMVTCTVRCMCTQYARFKSHKANKKGYGPREPLYSVILHFAQLRPWVNPK